MCLAQWPQRSDPGDARTGGLWARVKHSTTEPLVLLLYKQMREQTTKVVIGGEKC